MCYKNPKGGSAANDAFITTGLTFLLTSIFLGFGFLGVGFPIDIKYVDVSPSPKLFFTEFGATVVANQRTTAQITNYADVEKIRTEGTFVLAWKERFNSYGFRIDRALVVKPSND